jgi:hypothetical protein
MQSKYQDHLEHHCRRVAFACGDVKETSYATKAANSYENFLVRPITVNIPFKSVHHLLDPSSEISRLSCSVLLAVVESVCKGETQCGSSLLDGDDRAKQIAIAAKHAKAFGETKKVLILDLTDGATAQVQDEFLDDPNVLCVSIGCGAVLDAAAAVGRGAGAGFTVDISWAESNMGDPEYLAALFNVVLPIAYQFDPDLIIASAGFDYSGSGAMFGHFVHQMQNVAGGKLVVALQADVPIAAVDCIGPLMGDLVSPWATGRRLKCKHSALHAIRKVIKNHARYWSCLKFGVTLPSSIEEMHKNLNGRKNKCQGYLPCEYGRFSSTGSVNTISKGGDCSSYDNRVVQSNERSAKEAATDRSDSVASSDKKSAAISVPSTDYKPNEFATAYGSPVVQTKSSSNSRSQYEVTDTAKKNKKYL